MGKPANLSPVPVELRADIRSALAVLDRLPTKNPRAVAGCFRSLLNPEFLTTVPISVIAEYTV
jgi:hypothetical protein